MSELSSIRLLEQHLDNCPVNWYANEEYLQKYSDLVYAIVGESSLDFYAMCAQIYNDITVENRNLFADISEIA